MSRRTKILITGGAGFIGSHLADHLIGQGYSIRALDCLNPQVHLQSPQPPDYLNPDVELMIGDVRDRSAVRHALEGVSAVYHFAARVGVGQSMYEIADYTSTNNEGTAVLMEELINHRVERLVVASSMSIYGEGLYRSPEGEVVEGQERPLESLRAGHWELMDGKHEILAPMATPETKTPCLSSIYALSKYDQEKMCLVTGKAYGIPTVALRFFNVYGTRQALSNPYTGVLAIFSSLLMNGKPPLIYEDGLQQRDFVHVQDVVQACRLALETPDIDQEVFNVGSGHRTTIAEVARKLAEVLDRPDLPPEITGRYRAGDIRHCFADITRARLRLGYEPRVTFEAGLSELVEWLSGQEAHDRVAEAGRELQLRGLTL